MDKDKLVEELRRVKILLDAERRVNRPIGNGERVVGFVLPEDVAGLSDGLFMLDALCAAALRSHAQPK